MTLTSTRQLRRALCAAAATWIAAPALAAPAERRRAATSDTAEPSYGRRADIQAFAAELAQRHRWPAGWIRERLALARRMPQVRQLIMPAPAGTSKNWQAYRDRFVEPERIGAGAAFWRSHQGWLEQAHERFGVPPEMVVAIVGVETFYGRIMGGFRVIDALATLGFDFPPGRSDRSAFFRSELEEFFIWCMREGIDPLLPKGSYAGAIGLAQFMPSSINRYAVDFDSDGRIDLRGNPADAIGSVANYFARFGWTPGLATHFAVEPPAAAQDLAALRAPDIVPNFSALQFGERGARLDVAGRAHRGPLALVELENGDRPASYVAGTSNFYTVTRYNWSAYYAMAVITLAQALKAAR